MPLVVLDQGAGRSRRALVEYARWHPLPSHEYGPKPLGRAAMIACPPTATLRDLLHDSLPADSAPDVRAHVEGCSSCLETLDHLSDDPQLDSWMAEGLGDEPAGSARRAALGGLRPARRAESLARLGAYEIEAEVGRGGMGVVYRARDRTLGRVVALKVLNPGPDDERTRGRFAREVRAAARVEHDHLVRVYATADPAEPVLYFAMEYLDGPSLAGRIRGDGRLDPRAAAELVEQASRGLAAAHAAGLVHRDVKPDNILIDPANGRAKVADFGLARLDVDAALTRDGVIAGTPAYLSPEQARGDPEVGPLADVYGLGVTLYECLAGEPPFRGTPHRIVHQILNDEPRPPRALNDLIPRDLQTVCLKAMDKGPGRRYADASELAADLRRWLDGEPVRARAIGPAGRLARLVRRYPRVSALAAALVVASMAGLGGILWQWRRAEANGRQSRAYLARALGSIDTYFTRVSENRLLDVPNLQPLRQELLAAARDYYADLLRDRPDDPGVRVELAKARARLGMVVSLVGSYGEASGLLDRSLSEFDAVLAERPGDLAARNGRIAALVNAAAVRMHASKLDDCRATAGRLIAICEADRVARPGAVEPLEGLYAAHHDRGNVAARRGEPAGAVAAEFERALAANRELLALKPDHAPYLRNTSRSAALLGDAYGRGGRQAEGLAIFAEGYRAAKRLRAEHPESLEYRFSLAPYESGLGGMAFRESLSLKGSAATAKLDEARAHYAAALDLDRGLVRENPGADQYRVDLLALLAAASLVEYDSGRLDSALAMVREARDVYAAVRHAENEYGYVRVSMANLLCVEGYALSQVGRHDAALKSLDEAAAASGSLTPRERDAQGGAAVRETTLACARAFVLGDAGRLAEAVAAWDRAIAIAPAEARGLLELTRDLLRAEAGQGPPVDPRRAPAVVAVADALCASGPMAARANVMYARIYALAAAASEGAARDALDARAVFRLEKAAQAGYFREPGRLDRVAADPTLDRLRGRPDYAEFRERARAR